MTLQEYKNRLADIRHVFLDMDGTIYCGKYVFPTTRPFLDFLAQRGIGYTFLTNNSSRTRQEYADKLTAMGIPATEENIYSSTEYCIDHLQKNLPHVRKIHLLSVPSIRDVFQRAGFTVTNDIAPEPTPDAVIVAFDKTITYETLCRAAWHLHNGVPGIATHPDVFCPCDEPTWLVDCGAITALLETATSTKITTLGKPDPNMLLAAAARHNLSVDRCLMVGDRLKTDIAVGLNAGALTCRIAGQGADMTPAPDVIPQITLEHLGQLQDLMA